MSKSKEVTNRRNYVYRYDLEPYTGSNSRHTCPQCGQKNKFTRYVDVETGQYVGDDIGRCDREHTCGYNKPPSLQGKPSHVDASKVLKQFNKPNDGSFNTLPSILINQHLTLGQDNLSKFLLTTPLAKNYYQAALTYRLGVGDRWSNATMFWQIDKDMKVRTGKELIYDASTGKRVKEPRDYIDWIHRRFGDFNLKQCLFGEHLVNFDAETYNIVESEKTAIICFMKNPKTLWLATGGLNNLKYDKLLPFKGKKLVLYPDKGSAYNKWVEVVEKNKLRDEFDITFSDFLESKHDLEEGSDIADYILRNVKENTT